MKSMDEIAEILGTDETATSCQSLKDSSRYEVGGYTKKD